MNVIKGVFKKPRWVSCRAETRRARIEHNCYKCNFYIFPGEEYVREVLIWKSYVDNKRRKDRDRVLVRKRHEYCPLDPEEEERYHRDSDEDRSQESNQQAA